MKMLTLSFISVFMGGIDGCRKAHEVKKDDSFNRFLKLWILINERISEAFKTGCISSPEPKAHLVSL